MICVLRIAPGNRRKQKFHQVTPAIADKVFQLKWYCSTGVFPFGAQVRQRCGRSLSPLSSMKTMVRPSVSAFFLTPASAPASTAWLRPAPEPVLPDAGNSNPVAAECAKPARYGSGPRIPPRSSAPPATPSTVRSHSPMLPAHASARTLSSSSPVRSGGACVRRARLSSDRAIPPLPVAAPTDSPIAGARRPAAPPRTDEFP
jgi:hypothetical protein